MELTGRTIYSKPLVCRVMTVSGLKRLCGPFINVVVTTDGEYRLGEGMKLDDFTIGETYFFQTVDVKHYNRPIVIVDYIKF